MAVGYGYLTAMTVVTVNGEIPREGIMFGSFLPRNASAERDDATVSCLSVCPSVCLSVRP